AQSGSIKLKAAGGVLTVNSPSAIAHVEVYSVAGMEVLGAAPMTTSATLSLEALPKGVYVVRVSATDGTSATAKFVK
ncbi:MAG: T9SS type A sorting domain-containing protein, partial [Muribaculaceae bacterium]